MSWKCKCGYEALNGFKFCPYCGTVRPVEPEFKVGDMVKCEEFAGNVFEVSSVALLFLDAMGLDNIRHALEPTSCTKLPPLPEYDKSKWKLVDYRLPKEGENICIGKMLMKTALDDFEVNQYYIFTPILRGVVRNIKKGNNMSITIEECATRIFCERYKLAEVEGQPISINNLIDDSVASAKRLFAECKKTDKPEPTAKQILEKNK